MASNYRDADVGCPFYRSTDGWRIVRCEGIVDDCCLSLNFGKKQDYKTHIGTFCCEHYEYCEIYRMLMKAKYEEET